MENENHVYIWTIYFYIAISMMNIISNPLSGFPLQMNVKWYIFGAASIIGLLFTKKNANIYGWAAILLLVAILIVLPMACFEQGGVGILIAIYIAALVVVITFLLRGWLRYTMLGTLSFLLCLLTLYEYIFPNYEKYIIYPTEQPLTALDSLLQIIIIILGVSTVSIIFSNEWYKGKENVKIYAKRLEEQNAILDWMANHDPLTNVYNRNYLHSYFESLSDQNLYLMIVDIDNFKHVNDTYGHVEGDRILKEIANALTENVPGISGRYGGDEFLVIFSNTTLDEIKKYAHDFQTHISNIKIGTENITISGGLTKVEPSLSQMENIAYADQLLYYVKHHGKNDIQFS